MIWIILGLSIIDLAMMLIIIHLIIKKYIYVDKTNSLIAVISTIVITIEQVIIRVYGYNLWVVFLLLISIIINL